MNDWVKHIRGFVMGRLVKRVSIILFFSVLSLGASVPPGFEQPGLVDQLVSGNIVVKKLVDTNVEVHSVSYAYFHKTSPEAYAEAIAKHETYKDLFAPDVKEGKTLRMSRVGNDMLNDYMLTVVVKMGIISKTFLTEFKQDIKLADAPNEESTVNEVLTNYQDYVPFSKHHTRLVPYANGFLVSDEVHFKIAPSASTGGVFKSKLNAVFGKYLKTFREVLRAEP